MSDVSIELEFDPIYFSVADLWPDGDQPETVDADAVAALIAECGGLVRVIRDWDLCPSVTAFVRRENPHWKGDEVLFPEIRPPRLILTRAIVS